MTKARTKEEFIGRWKKWCECFDDNEKNSINSQITRMVWDYAIWNLINVSRQYNAKNEDGTPMANGVLHNSINKWFFETQMTAIRRLIDACSIDGERGVYSIISVLNDMLDNIEYLTRENIFELRDLQYDYSPLIEAERKYLDEHSTDGTYACHIPAEMDSSPCEDLHELMDILSGASKETRDKGDRISVNFMIRLKDNLMLQCTTFKDIVDKYYAHAATKESRTAFKLDDPIVSLQEYKDAHESLCKCADLLQLILLDKSNKYLPIEQPTLFLNWDKSLFQGKDERILQGIWDEYNKRTNDWVLGFEELKKMMVK